MLSKIVVTVAKKRNETTAYSSWLLPVAMTVPVRIWFSLGISRPTSVIASATIPKACHPWTRMPTTVAGSRLSTTMRMIYGVVHRSLVCGAEERFSTPFISDRLLPSFSSPGFQPWPA